MKCHYIKHEGKKIFIPGCWGTIHSFDLYDCHCDNKTFAKFEKERYNTILNQKNKLILELENKIKRLTNSKP